MRAVERPAADRAWLDRGLTMRRIALDGVDGWLARRTQLSSPFGRAVRHGNRCAPDRSLLSLLVWRFDKAGGWVLACGLMRYVFVAAGWMLAVAGRAV